MMTTRALALLLLCPALAWGWLQSKGYSDAAAPAFVPIAAGTCQGGVPGSNFDLPAASAPTPVCVTGANGTVKGVLEFPDTSGGFSAQLTMPWPKDWTTAVMPGVALYWTTTGTTASTYVKWTVQFICSDLANTTTDDPTFPPSGAGFNTVTTVVPTTQNRVQTSTIAAVTLPASCVTATAELVHVRIFRDGGDAADTAGAPVRLIALMLTPSLGH